MKHVLVNTHTSDTCAFRSPQHREELAGSIEKFRKGASAQGVVIEGLWVNMSAHTIFAVLEASSAHVIDAALRDSGLVGLTDSRVYAVEDMDTALAATAR